MRRRSRLSDCRSHRLGEFEASCAAARPGAGCASRARGPLGRRGPGSDHGSCGFRPQHRPLACPRVEREASCHLHRSGSSWTRLPDRDRRARARGAGRDDLEGIACPPGTRRSDPQRRGPEPARQAGARCGRPQGRRLGARRRVLLRLAPNGTRLEAVFLHHPVRAALGADRRPDLVSHASFERSGRGGRVSVQGRSTETRRRGHGPRCPRGREPGRSGTRRGAFAG